jgi:hypothetical protein
VDLVRVGAGAGPIGSVNNPTHGGTGNVQADTGVRGPSGDLMRDVAPPDLEATGELDWFLDDAFAHVTDSSASDANAAYANAQFKRQIKDPAQALTSADLTQEHFDLAWRLLEGSLTEQTDPAEMSDRQRRAADLTAADALANTLYGVWKTLAQVLGAFTFGLTTIAAQLVDSEVGQGGSLTDELNRRDAQNKLRRAMTDEQLLNLVRWLGPVPVIGGVHPAYVDLSKPPAVPPASTGTSVTPAGIVPDLMRWQLTAGGASGRYLRWNAVELTSGLSFRQRVNLRARIYRALDIIACQLFPYVDNADAKGLLAAGVAPHEPPGLYCYYNGRYRGADGQASGWIKGSIFHPVAGDNSYEGIVALRKAATQTITPQVPTNPAITQIVPQAPPTNPAITAINPGTVGSPSTGPWGGIGHTTIGGFHI